MKVKKCDLVYYPRNGVKERWDKVEKLKGLPSATTEAAATTVAAAALFIHKYLVCVKSGISAFVVCTKFLFYYT